MNTAATTTTTTKKNNDNKTKKDEKEESNNNNIESSASLKLSSIFSSIQNNILNRNNNNNNNTNNNNATTEFSSSSSSSLKQQQPNSIVKDEEANKLAAQEICSVPANERERILEEVHGIYQEDVMNESEELIETSLIQLSQEIHYIRKKAAYNRAFFLAPHYVSNKKFLLMFLRADRFDCQRAARRIVKHFEVKLFLWGEDKLGRDITPDDFSEEIMEYYQNGHVHFIPGGDSVGRPVFLYSWKHLDTSDIKYERLHQVTWYLYMNVLSNNENAQRTGLVIILYLLETNISSFLYDCCFNLHLIRDGYPVRFAAIHTCVDTTVEFFVPILRVALGKEWRLRFRVHCGSNLECQNQLMGFGISQRTFPIDEDGAFKFDQFENTLHHRTASTNTSTSNPEGSTGRGGEQGDDDNNNSGDDKTITATSSTIMILQSTICVTEKDVLFGRGKPFQSHSGNLELMKLIDQNLDDYYNAPSKQQQQTTTTLNSSVSKQEDNDGLVILGGLTTAGRNQQESSIKQQQQQQQQQQSSSSSIIIKSKADIMLEMVEKVQTGGGRFLQRVTIPAADAAAAAAAALDQCIDNNTHIITGIMDEERWVEVNNSDAINKIYYSIRQRSCKSKSKHDKSAITTTTTTTNSSRSSSKMVKKDKFAWNNNNNSFQEMFQMSRFRKNKEVYCTNGGEDDYDNEGNGYDDDEKDSMSNGKVEKRHRYK